MNLQHPVRTLIGIVATAMSIVGAVFLVCRAVMEGSTWHVVSFSIYGTSLVALWAVSTIYHSLNVSRAAHRTLEQIDHAMIYFLIAGTYTPLCLVVLRGGWGWSLFGVNWALAIAGIVLKLTFRTPRPWLVAFLFGSYLLMGWLIVIAWSPLVLAISGGGIFWLLAGGLFFTLGTVVLNMKGLQSNETFGAHEIWHLFVLAGSASHFWFMLRHVLAP